MTASLQSAGGSSPCTSWVALLARDSLVVLARSPDFVSRSTSGDLLLYSPATALARSASEWVRAQPSVGFAERVRRFGEPKSIGDWQAPLCPTWTAHLPLRLSVDCLWRILWTPTSERWPAAGIAAAFVGWPSWFVWSAGWAGWSHPSSGWLVAQSTSWLSLAPASWLLPPVAAAAFRI